MKFFNTQPCVVIFSGNKDVFTNPTIELFLTSLLQKNVTIIAAVPIQYYYSNYSNKIVFVPYKKFLKPFSSLSIRKKISFVKYYFSIYRRILFYKNVSLIGIDQAGLIWAGRINKLLKAKLGYFSFEILFKNETLLYTKNSGDDSFLLLKQMEEKYFPKINFLLIQDSIRLKIICEENKYIPERSFMIPVSSEINSVSISDEKGISSVLGIPPNKYVIVYSGSVQDWSGLFELLTEMEQNWDERFWLLIHTRIQLDDDNKYFRKVALLRGKGIGVSFHNRPFNDYKDLISFIGQFHFGLVTYMPNTHPLTGNNIKEIGLASGKFSNYMMLGMPVIVTECETYRNLNKDFNFGVVVEKIQDIPKSMPLLLIDLEDKQKACKNLYRNRLNPCNEMNKLIDYLVYR